MHLGSDISKMNNVDGKECWAISSEKYCTSLATNVESILEESGLRFPPKCATPIRCGYFPDMDVTGDLKADGVQFYQ